MLTDWLIYLDLLEDYNCNTTFLRLITPIIFGITATNYYKYNYGSGNGYGYGYDYGYDYGYGYGYGCGYGFGYGFGYDYFNAYNEEH